MVGHAHDEVCESEFLVRLDALCRRLDEQAAVIAQQQTEITKQQDEIALQGDLIRRFTVAPASGTGQAAPPSTARSTSARSAPRSRRAMLSRVLGATAAGALLALAKEADPAHAFVVATVNGSSDVQWGLLATPTPNGFTFPALGSTVHGVVGHLPGSPLLLGPVPDFDSAVLGTAFTGVGVQGTTTGAYGVHGKVLGTISTGSAGVRGEANAIDQSFGVWGSASSNLTGGVFGLNASTTKDAAGIYAYATAATGAVVGMWGRTQSATDGTIATLGEAIATSGHTVGVLGRVSSPNGIGVQGTAIGNSGVAGVSNTAAGVFGTSTTAYGVQGASQNAYGVSGNSTTQAGVWGSSNNNVGVLGTSTSGVGVNGVSVSSNGVNALSSTGIGIYAASPSGQAGRFDGDVVIIGNLTVSGSFPHSTAVASSDGTLRRLFSLESAEAYFEDVGQGSLTNGIGVVTLDPAFAALVRADAYQVFLTAYGDNRGLYVSNQTSSGFEVREVQGGTSSIGFGYRVIARPRDLPTSRLDRVTLPPSPPQPKLDRVEPLDVPATLRDLRRNDGPTVTTPAGQPAHRQDGR